MTNNSHPDDARLIGHLEGRLSVEDREALLAHLSADDTLRVRLDRIERGGPIVAPAFEALKADAPRARLEALLSAAIATDETRRVLERPRTRALRMPRWQPGLVAAATALFLLGGVLGAVLSGWIGSDNSEMADSQDSEMLVRASEGWRQAVAEYWSLTTADTLAFVPTPERAAAELRAASAKLGVDLAGAPGAFPALSFRGAQLFDFQGRPLVQIAYLDPEHGPIAYCVIAKPDKADLPPTTEEIDGFTVVHWASNGQARLLIGRAPAEYLQALARNVAS
jgi:anti-sigma factor RsiW